MSQLNLHATCQATNWNARAEGKGEGRVKAGDLRCSCLLDADDLEALVGHIGEEAFAAMRNSNTVLKVGRKVEKAEVTILTQPEDGIVIYQDTECDLKNFELDFADGGMFQATFSIGVRGIDNEDSGDLHDTMTLESIYVRAMSKQTGLDLSDDEEEEEEEAEAA